MNILKDWLRSLKFFKQPQVGWQWRIVLGETYSIWWHQIWWLLILLIITRLGIVDFFVLKFPSKIFELLRYIELLGWLIVYFMLHASLYISISEDERVYSWLEYAKLLCYAAIPLIICKTISTLLYVTSPLMLCFISAALAPFGIGIKYAVISALFTFFMLELLASNHTIADFLRSLVRAFIIVLYSYPFLVLSHIIASFGEK